MISIIRATEADYEPIVNIGSISVAEAHRDSTSAENLNEYLEKNYNQEAIIRELRDPE
ncbi:MAG: hypothetical protein IPI66_13745 [Chitinophagaceae bacterium]|nr:hypothetical protein [Chitinophagaceae bacterium]